MGTFVKGHAMNCVEFKDTLFAYIEGLLDKEEAGQSLEHLRQCPQCRAEHEAFVRLQKHLSARDEQFAGMSVVEPVMNRILQEKTRESLIISLFRTRWGMGLSAAAGVALVVLIVFLLMPGGQATAAEIIERGVRAVSKLESVHMQCRARTLPNDNFDLIGADYDFADLEIWKQFGDQKQWRIDKPGRMAVMDGSSTYMLLKRFNEGIKMDYPSADGFDTKWLHDVADASVILTSELSAIRTGLSDLNLTEKTGADGKIKKLVAIENIPNLPQDDYLKNKSFHTTDTRREYVFDAQSERLESIRIYMLQPPDRKLIFETVSIDYNQPISPEVFHPVLSENIKWRTLEQTFELPEVPDAAFYATLTPVQAAERFFTAAGNYNWTEAGNFWPGDMDDRYKQYLGGLTVINIGETFTSRFWMYRGVFVPYEIRLANGEIRKHNLALKQDAKTGRWRIDGGMP
ncbi:MAG: hypothetical protein LBJ21_02505 [Acidobacteriota bacterium]|jgi:hypothetical protein|nr:hypothetical protein [Acidobacteriota bacterium]